MRLKEIVEELEIRLNYLKVKRGDLIILEIPHSEYKRRYEEYSCEIEVIYNMLDVYRRGV